MSIMEFLIARMRVRLFTTKKGPGDAEAFLLFWIRYLFLQLAVDLAERNLKVSDQSERTDAETASALTTEIPWSKEQWLG